MKRILALALALATSTGCVGPIATVLVVDALDGSGSNDDLYYDTGDYGYDDGSGFSADAAGSMRGQMPGTPSFDRDLTSGYVYGDSSFVDLDLWAETDDADWAMMYGSIETSSLVDGEWVVLDDADGYVIGCSGSSPWETDYDDEPRSVRVLREPIQLDGEPMYELTIEASFGDDGDLTAVIVQPRPQPNPED